MIAKYLKIFKCFSRPWSVQSVTTHTRKRRGSKTSGHPLQPIAGLAATPCKPLGSSQLLEIFTGDAYWHFIWNYQGVS
jgi:hypothetical protein